jgi:hypothetical protein
MLGVSECVLSTTVLSDRFLQNLVLKLSNRGHANACFKLRTMRSYKMADALLASRLDGQNVTLICCCTVAHIRFVSGSLLFRNIQLPVVLFSTFVVLIHCPFFVLDIIVFPFDRQKYVYLCVRLCFVLCSFLISSVCVRIGKILF